MRIQNRGKVKLSPLVFRKLSVFAQDTFDKKEAGGVLLGRHIIGSDDIVVDDITTPMKGDYCGRYFFIRGQRNHQEVIDKVWQESKGTCTYLGEWHTHPEKKPKPSCLDLDEWMRRIKNDTFYGDALFFIIVGTTKIRVWEGQLGLSKCIFIGSFNLERNYRESYE